MKKIKLLWILPILTIGFIFGVLNWSNGIEISEDFRNYSSGELQYSFNYCEVEEQITHYRKVEDNLTYYCVGEDTRGRGCTTKQYTICVPEKYWVEIGKILDEVSYSHGSGEK